MTVTLTIINVINGQEVKYNPVVADGITWETNRVGSCGKLSFTVVKEQTLSSLGGFIEGSKVALTVDGVNVFYGVVFEKSRDKDQNIEVTAYDQLRYFTNKDTLQYVGWTASDLLRKLCSMYDMPVGTIENTAFVIPFRDETNQTLFDMVLNALDLTRDAVKKDYILYDEFGTICLRSKESMRTDYYISGSNAENFNVRTSIDQDTANIIRVRMSNKETGKMDVAEIRDLTAIDNWGMLRMVVDVPEGSNIANIANTLILLKSRKTREITISGVKGDLSVRGGSSVKTYLDFDDTYEHIEFQCDKVVHHFTADNHTMDLTLFDATVRANDHKLSNLVKA